MQAGAEATAAARQSAYNAKKAWAVSKGRPHTNTNLAMLKKGSMPNANYRNMRAKVEAAARSSYAEIKAELMAEVAKGGECARVTEADIEFISMAFSQLLTEEEIESLDFEPTGAAGGYRANGSQGGGARYKQKGGALGRAIMNFFRSMCSRAGRYSANSNATAAGNVDALAAAVATTSHADITQNLIIGMAGVGTARGLLTGHNGLATVALTAFNIVNSMLPNSDVVIANSASYMTSWVPVAAAAAPVVGKLAVIGACAIAVWETNMFVLNQGAALFRGAGTGGIAGYKEFLKGLCFHLFRVFSRYVTGSIQRRTAYAANVRRTLAAGAGAGGGGGGGPPSADERAIDAAVDAALPAAGGGLEGAFQVATAQEPVAAGGASAAGGGSSAAGTGLLGFSPAPAPSAPGGGGTLSTVTEEQAEEAADAATQAGEVAEEQSQAGPQGGAAAAAAEENSQAAGFEGMNLPQGNLTGRNAFNFNARTTSTRMGVPVNRGAGVPGPASGAPGLSPAALAMAAAGAAASAPAPSARGTKRTLTAAAAAPGGGAAAAAPAPAKRGRGGKGGKGGKSRKQHGGRRSQKKTRKNRK